MTKKSIFFSVLISLFALQPLWAQTTGMQTLAQLKESPAGSKILKFIDIINNNRAFTDELIKELFSATIIQKHKISGLRGFLEDVKTNDKTITLFDANRKGMFKYELKIKNTAGEWVNMPFTFEKEPPYGIEGVGAEITNVGAVAKTPLIKP